MLRHTRSLVALAAIVLLAETLGSAQIPVPMPGTISTIAGNGNTGIELNQSLAISNAIGGLTSVALDAAGDIYFADSSNNQVAKINAKTGMLTLVAEVPAPWGIAVDASGNLFISDPQNNLVRRVDASTGVITTVAGSEGSDSAGNPNLAINTPLSQPTGIGVDSKGNLYIAESKGNIVQKVDVTTGVISTVAGTGTYGYSGDGGPAISAHLDSPTAVAVDAAGNLYIADYGNDVVRRVAASSGVITTVAGTGTSANYTDANFGDGGPATSADVKWPEFINLDSAGNLYIGDYANAVIRKVNISTGIINTIVGNGTAGYFGDGGPAIQAEMRQPFGFAIGSTGNLYIADVMNFRLRVVATGAGSSTTPYVTVTSSDPKPTMNESVTLTAQVVNGSGASVSGGQINWYDGSTLLGQSAVGAGGDATYLADLTQAGSHAIVAAYTGVTGSNLGNLNLLVSGFSVSSNSLTANAPSGTTDTFALKVNAFSGFTGTVDLSCAGMSLPGSCSLSTSSVTLTNGTTTAPVVLTVTTMSETTASAKTGSGFPAGMVLACLCPLFLLGSKRARRSLVVVPLMFCALIIGTGVIGCGGGTPKTTTTTTVNRVPKGTYTVTVTATSGSTTVQVPITIIINS